LVIQHLLEITTGDIWPNTVLTVHQQQATSMCFLFHYNGANYVHNWDLLATTTWKKLIEDTTEDKSTVLDSHNLNEEHTIAYRLERGHQEIDILHPLVDWTKNVSSVLYWGKYLHIKTMSEATSSLSRPYFPTVQ
jgi:hypothetical protein